MNQSPPTGMMASLSAAAVTLALYFINLAGVQQPPSEAIAAAIVLLNYAGHAAHRVFVWWMRRSYPDFPDTIVEQ